MAYTYIYLKRMYAQSRGKSQWASPWVQSLSLPHLKYVKLLLSDRLEGKESIILHIGCLKNTVTRTKVCGIDYVLVDSSICNNM